jgi:hypothetical protein
MFSRFMVLVVLLIGLALPAWGQDTGVSDACTAEVAAQMQTAVESEVARARTAVDAGDVPEWRNAMQTVRNLTALLDGLCADYVFEGSGSKVLGPVAFVDGVYKATLVMDDTGSMGFEELGGDCDLVPSMMIMGGGTDEDAFKFIGCETLIEVRGSSTRWTLAFELVAPIGE